MPIVVDHEKRRAQIADVVKTMIAETGMDSVTVRAVARRAGFSSMILGHYFADKQDLLISAFASVLEDVPIRVREVMDEGGSLLDCLCALMPTTDANVRDWQAWFGFWGKATHDPALAAQRLAAIEKTQTTLAMTLSYAIERGELPPEVDVLFHSNVVHIYLNGLASMIIMKPEAWSIETQRDALQWKIDLIAAHPGRTING